MNQGRRLMLKTEAKQQVYVYIMISMIILYSELWMITELILGCKISSIKVNIFKWHGAVAIDKGSIFGMRATCGLQLKQILIYLLSPKRSDFRLTDLSALDPHTKVSPLF